MPPVHIIFEQCKCLPTLSCVRGIIFKPAHKLSCVILQCIVSQYFVYIQCTRPCLVPSCIIKKLWITSHFGLRTIQGYKSSILDHKPFWVKNYFGLQVFYFGSQAIVWVKNHFGLQVIKVYILFWITSYFGLQSLFGVQAILGYKAFPSLVGLQAILGYNPFQVIHHYEFQAILGYNPL